MQRMKKQGRECVKGVVKQYLFIVLLKLNICQDRERRAHKPCAPSHEESKPACAIPDVGGIYMNTRKGTYEFTSESVTEGHPDKICYQISDGILDSLLSQDPDSRVAIECLTTTGSVHVAGEVTTKGFADVQSIARTVLKDIGYTNPEYGIDCDDAGVWVAIH